MRRAVLWGAGAVVLALAIWVVAAHSFFRPILAIAPVVVYAVVLLVRVVMEPVDGPRDRRREEPAPPAREPVRGPRDDEAAVLDPPAGQLEDAVGLVLPD